MTVYLDYIHVFLIRKEANYIDMKLERIYRLRVGYVVSEVLFNFRRMITLFANDFCVLVVCML